jgi:hypothetical protein
LTTSDSADEGCRLFAGDVRENMVSRDAGCGMKFQFTFANGAKRFERQLNTRAPQNFSPLRWGCQAPAWVARPHLTLCPRSFSLAHWRSSVSRFPSAVDAVLRAQREIFHGNVLSCFFDPFW